MSIPNESSVRANTGFAWTPRGRRATPAEFIAATTARAPQRIQLRRTKGWRKPEGAVVVARPTRWGNPFRIGAPDAYWMGPGYGSPFRPDPVPLMDARHVVDIYRSMVETGHAAFDVEDVRSELAGKDLACWCPLDQPCHADVLLELANGGAS